MAEIIAKSAVPAVDASLAAPTAVTTPVPVDASLAAPTAVTTPVPVDASLAAPTATPVAPAADTAMALPSHDAGGDGDLSTAASPKSLGAYKSYWSRFKRPASVELLSETIDPPVMAEPVEPRPAAEAMETLTVPAGHESLSLALNVAAGAEVPIGPTSKDSVDRGVVATGEMSGPIVVPDDLLELELWPDNQLGDPTMYPDLSHLCDPPMTPQGSVAPTAMDSPTPGAPGGPKPGAVPDPGAVQMERVPVNLTGTPKHHMFAPTAEDVKACLLRKTTVDLTASPPPVTSAAAAPSLTPPVPAVTSRACSDATPAATPVATLVATPAATPAPVVTPMAPKQMPDHTSVVMNLGGVMQDVWVPLSREAAVAAGLTPSDAYRPASPVNADPTPPSVPAAIAPSGPAASVPAPEGATAEDESRAVMKAAYMRFHRSVNSSLNKTMPPSYIFKPFTQPIYIIVAALIFDARMYLNLLSISVAEVLFHISLAWGKTCPPEIAQKFKEIKAKGNTA